MHEVSKKLFLNINFDKISFKWDLKLKINIYAYKCFTALKWLKSFHVNLLLNDKLVFFVKGHLKKK